MLERLEIHHYALIDDVSISFNEGFTVITGETGAGKSIILGALSLLLGERADAQSIRNGCDMATIDAGFRFSQACPAGILDWLEDHGLALDDGLLVVGRTLRRNGRSTCTVQGRLTPLGDLARIGDLLFDISAQRNHQSLLRPSYQRDLLDAFCSCGKQREAYAAQYRTCKHLAEELEELNRSIDEGRREADYLHFAVDEIRIADPKAGEDEAIAEQVRIASSFEEIDEALSTVSQLLHGGGDGISTIGAINRAVEELAAAEGKDPSLENLHARLESVGIECEDIYESVRDYLSSMTFSQQALDDLQARQALLQRLKKKYGASLEAVIAFREEGERKLRQSEDGEQLLADLKQSIENARKELDAQAHDLSKARKRGAMQLGREIEATLRTLGMPQATFSIAVTPLAHPDESGTDSVGFTICANPGMEARSIKDVASGGELSRILLAVKTTLAAHDRIPTIVFDEVDAGIGGSVAGSVADSLSELGKSHQVVAITHLATIAAKATNHLVVVKQVRDGMSYSSLSVVKGQERVGEIARMLSGDSDAISLEHAQKLLGGHA